MEDFNLEDSNQILLCRKIQIDWLKSILSGGPILNRSIVVYGRSSTGKTSVLSFVLNKLKAKFALVNCAECDSSRLLYEFVLDAISGHRPCSQNKFSHYVHCDNANDFIRYFDAEIDKQQLNDQPFYIVFKNVEHLRKVPGNIIPMLLRIAELSQRNVCPVFISGVNPEKLCSPIAITEILPVHFPEYSKDELVEILVNECPLNYTLPFYSNFIKLVLSVFYPVCRNLREIRHIVRKHFLLYVEPIKKGELSENDVTKLWRNIEPHLKSNLHQVYLRDSGDNNVDVQSTKSKETWRVELPFYSKYLLIAAYLASYNPAKLDKQYFLKKHDKVTKRMKLNKLKKKSVSFHLLGPKPFPLERLIAIFCSITEDSSALSFPILSQISSLISLNFLQKIGNKDIFDSPKFKCLISLEVVRSIARSVEFSIDRYLYDFT